MLAFILRRLGSAAIVLIFVGVLAFILFRYVGDPVNQMVGIDTSIADRDRLRESLGLNDSVIVQALRFLGHAAMFDFGVSYQFKRPVAELLIERMPATLELSLISALLSLVIGIPMGVASALGKDRWYAKLLQAVSLAGISLPTFLIGILFIYLFSVTLRWFPSFGRGDTVKLGTYWTTGLLTSSGLRALILPAMTLALFQMTLIMRLVRSEMLEVLRSDHIRFARARGLPARSINFRHALKNSLVPVITVAGLQLGSVIAFATITETVFQWPGMGLLFLQSVQNVDVPIMAAYLLFVAAMFVAINLVVDILYLAVDPRLKTTSKAH
ncbi:MAG: ABC transporter permease [Beijerinckiaceae bacterium]|nr:ABC transporter permease [Beijerinckiaceae bacterium]